MQEPAHPPPPPRVQVLPGILTSFLASPSGSPRRVGPLTQGSIQVLEDTAAVVQGDVDSLLQERGHQAAVGTGLAEGGGPALPLLLLPLPVTPGQPGALGPMGAVALFAGNRGLSESEGI